MIKMINSVCQDTSSLIQSQASLTSTQDERNHGITERHVARYSYDATEKSQHMTNDLHAMNAGVTTDHQYRLPQRIGLFVTGGEIILASVHYSSMSAAVVTQLQTELRLTGSGWLDRSVPVRDTVHFVSQRLASPRSRPPTDARTFGHCHNPTEKKKRYFGPDRL